MACSCLSGPLFGYPFPPINRSWRSDVIFTGLSKPNSTSEPIFDHIPNRDYDEWYLISTRGSGSPILTGSISFTTCYVGVINFDFIYDLDPSPLGIKPVCDIEIFVNDVLIYLESPTLLLGGTTLKRSIDLSGTGCEANVRIVGRMTTSAGDSYSKIRITSVVESTDSIPIFPPPPTTININGDVLPTTIQPILLNYTTISPKLSLPLNTNIFQTFQSNNRTTPVNRPNILFQTTTTISNSVNIDDVLPPDKDCFGDCGKLNF